MSLLALSCGSAEKTSDSGHTAASAKAKSTHQKAIAKATPPSPKALTRAKPRVTTTLQAEVKTPLAIRPREPAPPKNAGIFTFIIEKAGSSQGSSGNLMVRFVSKDPRWVLNTRKPFLLQLREPLGYTLDPSTLTEREWPPGKASAEIQWKEEAQEEDEPAPPPRPEGKNHALGGDATFTVCNKVTLECKQESASFDTVLSW